MTNEEKARAYDDALEQAKKELNTCGSIDCDAARQIFRFFPQLGKSNDERIRKGLIEALKASKTVGELKFTLPEPTTEECIAYLEKQKYNRMQPVYDNQESFESALDKAWKSYNESGARTVDSCEDDYTECAHAKGFREGYLFGLEKQKENKFIPRVLPCSAAWFEDCDENQREQKPGEWNEEDEEMLDIVLAMVDCSTIVPYSGGQLHPSESYKKDISEWLKSLRPQSHWKPSEEQMKALLKVVDKARELHYTSIDGYTGYNDLRSLYEQLKKLM